MPKPLVASSKGWPMTKLTVSAETSCSCFNFSSKCSGVALPHHPATTASLFLFIVFVYRAKRCNVISLWASMSSKCACALHPVVFAAMMSLAPERKLSGKHRKSEAKSRRSSRCNGRMSANTCVSTSRSCILTRSSASEALAHSFSLLTTSARRCAASFFATAMSRSTKTHASTSAIRCLIASHFGSHSSKSPRAMVWTSVPSLLNFIAFANVRRTSASTSSAMTYLPPFSMSFLIVPKSMGSVMISLYVGKPNASGSTGAENGNPHLWAINCRTADKHCLCTISNKHRYRSVLNPCCWSGLHANFCRIAETPRETDDTFRFASISFTLALAVWAMRLNSSRRSTKSVARWPRLFTKFSSSIRRFRSATRFERSSALARLLCDVVPPPTPIPPIPREGGRTGSSTSTTSAANGSAASAACARAAIPTPFALPFFVIPRFDVEGPTPTTPNPKSGKKSSPVGPNATTARADHRRASSSLVPYSAPSRDTCPIGPSTPKNSNPYGSFPANFATCVFVRIVSPRLARALAIQFVSRSRAFASPLASPSPSPSLAFFPRSARACPRAMSLYPTDGFFRFPPIAVVVVVVVVALWRFFFVFAAELIIYGTHIVIIVFII
mmetsp:Transcript_6984/g.28165  ORF Transcript_6984/g.28165 Transcript_6984/m.28165 type:complete len:614 (-) Transcript_6984:1560-3401(-)